jgi:LysM repeat protein
MLRETDPRLVRLLLFSSFVLVLAAWPGRAQVPDPGMAAQQDPAMIQANAETSKADIDAMKTAIAHLQADNAGLKQQLAALQATLDKSEADRAKERQALLDEVAALIAKNNAPHGITLHHHAPADDVASDATEVHPPLRNEVAETDASSGLAPHASTDADTATGAVSAPPDTTATPAPKPKPQKGYYHVVASGETLSMICEAYRDEGVKVTNAQVRKANGLTSKSVLKVGQKLFIPKPVD